MVNGKDVTRTQIGVFEGAGDVTSRKQAEEVLLKAGALQRAIFNSLRGCRRRDLAQAGGRGAAQSGGPAEARSSTAPTSRASPPTRRASSRSSMSAPSGCLATRPPK